MIGIPGNVRIYLACGATDMRRGFDSLAAQVQTMLRLDPHDGALYAFRGRRGDLIKILWWDGQGLSLFSKRLERGRFVWPQAREGSVAFNRRPGFHAAGRDRLADAGADLAAGRGLLSALGFRLAPGAS